MERRAAGPHPRLAHLRGQHEHRRVERRFLGPHPFAEVEQALAHDADAGAPERVLDDLMVGAGLAVLAELQILPEESRRQNPAVELAPLGTPILVARVVGVLQVHAGRYEISVEGDADAEEHLAHLYGPFTVWSGVETTAVRASHRSMSDFFEPL